MLKLASLFVALLVLCATSASTSAKPVKCYTPQAVIAKSRTTLQYRFEGEILDAFRQNFSIVLAKKSPDTANDLLLIFGEINDDDIWVVQGFKNGCRTSTRLTALKNLKRVLLGGTI